MRFFPTAINHHYVALNFNVEKLNRKMPVNHDSHSHHIITIIGEQIIVKKLTH
jgi:hypothetical protein